MFQLLIKLIELCKNLKQKVGVLEEENKTLKIENAELKERLGLNSRNSSIPSSKELYKMKENMPKDKPENSRKVGGQVGHKGNYRAKMEADKVVKIELSDACECGGEIAVSKEPYIHQKVDLPEIKPYVIEYQLEHGRCKRCGKRKSSKLPKEVTPDTFGPRIKSLITALSGFLGHLIPITRSWLPHFRLNKSLVPLFCHFDLRLIYYTCIYLRNARPP